MDIEKIKQANTKYIGKQIKYFEELESTHLYEELEQKEESGIQVMLTILQ